MNNQLKYYLVFIFSILFINLQSQTPDSQQIVIDSLKQEIAKLSNDSAIAEKYLELNDMYLQGDTEKNIAVDKAYFYAQKSGDKHLIAITMFHKAAMYNFYAQYDSAIVFFDSLISIFEKFDDTLFLAASWGEKGNSYCYQSIYDKCLDCFLKSLEYTKLLGNDIYLGVTTNNIGNVYYFMGNKDEAQKYFQKAYQIYKSIDFPYGLALSANNIGSVFLVKNQLDSAYFYLKISEENAVEIDYFEQLAEVWANLSQLFSQKNQLSKAIDYAKKSIAIYKELNSDYGLTKSYWSMGKLLFEQKKFNLANKYLDSALAIANNSGNLEFAKNSYLWKFKIDSATGKYKNAIDNYLKYNELKDSLKSIDVEKQIADLQSTFDLKQKEQENELLRAKQAEQQAVIQRQHTITLFSLIALFLFLLLIIVLIFFYKNQRKHNLELQDKNAQILQQQEKIITQNEILTSKNEEIEEQRTILQKINKNLTDSINYAKRIQDANLPDIENFKNIFSDIMLIFLPRDIVSGDFYYYKKLSENKHLIIVADCTGHGVPGALMSIMNITLLNEILRDNKSYTAAEILEKARYLVKSTLKDKNGATSMLEGMDAAVIIYDKKNMKINFAGANRPLFYIRDKQIDIIKPNRQPVAAFIKERDFTDHFIDIQQNDIIYLFSDGYIDQISKDRRKKILLKNFKEILLRSNDLSLSEQKNILLNMLAEHKGNIKQTDDITILALKI